MIRISWSSLRTHEECKQRSHLVRSHKRARLDNKRGFLPGSVTDRVVRNWLNNDPYSHPGEMPDMVDGMIESLKLEMDETEKGIIRWKSAADRNSVVAECVEAVTKIEPLLERLVLPFEHLPDFGFNVPVNLINPVTREPEPVVLNGYMDLLVRDNEKRYAVWDVKHTRDEDYWRKTVGQLGFYDLVVELMEGQATKITGLIQPLVPQQVKPYYPSVDSRAQLMQRIVGMANDIWRQDHTPTKNLENCQWCSVKHACTRFDVVMDDRGRKRAPL